MRRVNNIRKKLRKKKGKHWIMKLDTLQKLYTDELRDLYNAENQLLKALPKMAKAASSEELKEAFEKHLEQTKGHVKRLEQVFEGLDEKPKGKTCRAMKGLIEEGSEILQQEGEESILDAGIIVAAQKSSIMRSPVMAVFALLLIYSAKTRPQSSCKLLWMKNRKQMSFSTGWPKAPSI